MCLPFIKFITYIFSYLLFLIMLVFSSFRASYEPIDAQKFSIVYGHLFENYTNYVNNAHLVYKFKPSDFYIRPCFPFILEISICVWLLGMFVSEIKKVMFHGIRDYIISWNNVFTFIMCIVLSVSYGLKFYTYYRVSIEKQKLQDGNFWNQVYELDSHDLQAQKSIYETFYWLNQGYFL